MSGTAAILDDLTSDAASSATNVLTITVTGAATTAQVNIINAATTGNVTATVSDNDVATLSGLTTDGTDAITVTVTDASVAASALNTLDGKTTVNVIATAVGTLTGAAADVATAISATTIDTAANVAVTLSAGEAAATDLYTIDLNTSAWADASAVTKVNGTIADTLFVLDARGLNFKPDVAAGVNDTAIDAGALRALDAKTTGTITLTGFGQTITGTLSDVNAVLGTPGREASAAVVVTDSISAAEAETLAGLTTGIVTATIDAGAAGTINTALANNAAATDFWLDVDSESEKPSTKVRSKASGGLGDIYIFISGTINSPERLIEQYHNVIVGNPVLIPQWSLGWHQCKWGYETTDALRWNVNNYTEYDLPLDA